MTLALALGATAALGLFYSFSGRINLTFFFGRTVDPDLRTTAPALAITREYRMGVFAVTLLAAALDYAAFHSGYGWLSTGVVLFQAVGTLIFFGRANGQVRVLTAAGELSSGRAGQVISVPLTAPPAYWIPGTMAILLPLAVAAVGVALTIWLPVHGAGWAAGWQAFNGRLDGPSSNVLGLATGMLTAASAILLSFRTSARLRTRMAQYTIRTSYVLECVATLLLLATLAVNAYGVVITRTAARSLTMGFLAVAVVLLVWNQARARRFVPAPVEVGSDNRWRWGLFYANREDPALFVQSRCGAGYTLNYGRVAAWPISLGLVAYFVAMLFFLPHHR